MPAGDRIREVIRKIGLLGMVILGVCGPSACAMQSTPTPVEVPDNEVWIEWENRTPESYAITVLPSGAENPAYGEVEACSAQGMGVHVDEPFTIGIRDWTDDPSEPGRAIADERDWRMAGGHLLVVISEGGEVMLDTWTEQRVLSGLCP